jgi:hypothetical protein
MAIDLVVPNVADFNLRAPSLDLGPSARRVVARLSAHLSDPAVFWSARDRVLVLPGGYDPLWFDDVHRALGIAPPPVVSPEYRTGLLVTDLLHDGPALVRLRELVAGRESVRLLAWGATPEQSLLVAALRGWGLAVELDGVGEDGYWASLYLDSKVSCLDLARAVPGVRVPRSITVGSLVELRGALGVLLEECPRVMVKGAYGVGGEGSAVVNRGSPLDGFWETVRRDPFLHGFPLIVQEFVAHADGTGCPAVDMYVDSEGVRQIVPSAMTVDGHRFRSVVVGSSALPEPWAAAALRTGEQIGEAARRLGFRGWLCVDFVAGADGVLYLTEFNARRSGAMHSIGLLQHFGEDLTFSSHETVPLPGGGSSYREHVRPVFERLWAAGVRAYPSTVRGLSFASPVTGVVAAASTAGEAEGIVAGIVAELYPDASPLQRLHRVRSLTVGL